MANAIGIAGYAGPPSTMRKWTDTIANKIDKVWSSRIYSRNQIQAALLADMGYCGDTNTFEGEFGYWRFTGFENWNKEIVTKGLGDKWVCTEIRYEKYPCGY